MVIGLLGNANLLSIPALRNAWAKHNIQSRIVWIGVGGVIVCAGFGVGLYLLRSLNDPGRGLDLRSYIYQAAITLFSQKPITGYGLFTFGRGLLHLASTPPLSAHNSAHNLILNIAAELGVLGLLALLFTFVVVVRAFWQKWRTGSDRFLLIAAYGALVAVLTHHLFDDPTTLTPVVVLTGMIPLTLAIVPASIANTRRPTWGIVALAWIVILCGGFWNYVGYRNYFAALQTGDASALDRVATANPGNPIYAFYAGALLAQNPATRPDAIAAYRRFLNIEPYYAPAWVNLAHLASGNAALDALHHAYDLAPQSWVIAYLYGTAHEAAGQADMARAAYQQAVTLYPDVVVYDQWNSPIMRAVGANASISGQTILALRTGDRNIARALWVTAPPGEKNTPLGLLIDAWFALADGNKPAATASVARIDVGTPQRAYGDLLLARANGSTIDNDLDTLIISIQHPVDEENQRVSGIAFDQYWTIGASDYFLPDIFNPGADAPTFVLITDRILP
jgi:tetratricopeptide (TPR) repeat protein